MSGDRRTFPSISDCYPSNRASHSVAADLDGTLLVSRSSFPYFLLLAVEAGGLLRGLALLLASPSVLLLYHLVSESAAIQLLIFVSVAGIPIRDLELAARAVLPRFYAADVRADSWRAFRACGRRRVVVTANPTVMVEAFVRDQLGGDLVLGTELKVDRRTGRATGFVTGNGVMVGPKKRAAVAAEFGEELPELGLGDRDSDRDFMALCKEAYMVPPDKSAPRVPLAQLDSPVIIHDGRLVRRPEPLVALLTYLWLPLAFPLALLRLLLLRLPLRLSSAISGIRLAVRGRPPPPRSPGSVLVYDSRRAAIDPSIISTALGRRVPTVALSGDGERDKARITKLLQVGDVVVVAEGTRGIEEVMTAELSDRVVRVVVDPVNAEVFYGSTARGRRSWDRCFFLMNPRPGYEVEFLEPLTRESEVEHNKGE